MAIKGLGKWSSAIIESEKVVNPKQKKNEKQKSENQKQSTDRKLLENNSISVSSNRKNKSCRIQKKFLEWKKYPVEMAGEIYFNFLFP